MPLKSVGRIKEYNDQPCFFTIPYLQRNLYRFPLNNTSMSFVVDLFSIEMIFVLFVTFQAFSSSLFLRIRMKWSHSNGMDEYSFVTNL